MDSLLGNRAATALSNRQDNRANSFVHTHTGDKLTAPYFEVGSTVRIVSLRSTIFRVTFAPAMCIRSIPHCSIFCFICAKQPNASQVISGYRSPATNALLRQHSEGVAQHSLHLEGRAIDVRLGGHATKELAMAARSLSRGGVGFTRHRISSTLTRGVSGFGKGVAPRVGAAVRDLTAARSFRDARHSRRAHLFPIRACRAARWSSPEVRDRGAIAPTLQPDAEDKDNADLQCAAHG